MPNQGFLERIGLAFGGAKYFQTKLLPKAILQRYGFSEFYTAKQIRFAAESIGRMDCFEERMANALFGSPGQPDPLGERLRIRSGLGLVGDDATEVFKAYLGIEKHPSDPFGSDQAQETTGGLS